MAVMLVLCLNRSQRLLTCLVVLLAYWGLLLGFGAGDPYSLEYNIVRRIDTAVLGAAHLWQGKGIAFDPEGLLSTLPSVVNVVIGFEAAVLARGRQQPAALRVLGAAGAMLVAVALLWSWILPINKSLWTPSYVLYTSGISLLLFAALILAAGRPLLSRLLEPARIYGYNAIVVYALSWIWVRTLSVFVTLSDGSGQTISAYDWLFLRLQGLMSASNASLLFALLHVLLFWLLAWFLYKRRIAIRI
jgi:predicted acyltransferase